MIRSLKLFADCVESLRTAEKKYEEEPTPFNKAIVEYLQKKVDGWIVWVRQQKDSNLAKNVPPFIGKPQQQILYGGLSKEMYDKFHAYKGDEYTEYLVKITDLWTKFSKRIPILHDPLTLLTILYDDLCEFTTAEFALVEQYEGRFSTFVKKGDIEIELKSDDLEFVEEQLNKWRDELLQDK